MILELPNIDSFSIANIDRLKEELDNELSRFKGAVLGYSKSIQASTYSEESRLEIKKQYDYHIKPELEALRRQIKKNKLVNLIMKKIKEHPLFFLNEIREL